MSDPALAPYQNRYLHSAFFVSIFYFYNAYYSAMVYRYYTCHGRVFCHASCKWRQIYHDYAIAHDKQIVTRVLLNKNTYVGTVNQSPYFAGIIAGSMLWVGYCWVTRLVQRTSHVILLQSRADIISETESHAFVHLAFAIIFGLCLYNFFRAVTLDPGLCPRPAHDGELKAVSISAF